MRRDPQHKKGQEPPDRAGWGLVDALAQSWHGCPAEHRLAQEEPGQNPSGHCSSSRKSWGGGVRHDSDIFFSLVG